ncbi:MAG: LysR family transcriptional regulator [Pseudohongiellaceae bacterium]|nr:LysR family transcriptional regulator [Pseudohongiellaceae bacterium]
MGLKKCDLNLFLVFDTIYSERNLTEAAKSLSITQPAVSNALARLRKLFNDELFVRTARGMVPTPVAEGIAQNVSDALGLLNSSIMEREEFDPSVAERTYQVSMTDLAEAFILPKLIPFFNENAPKVSLQSYYVKRGEMLKYLARGELDFAVDVGLIDDPQLCHQSLIQDEYVCVVRRDHPVLQEDFTLEKYLSLQHIHVSSRKKGLGLIDLALLKLGKEREIKLRVQHYRVAATIVGATDLAVSIPRFLALNYDVEILPLPVDVAPLDYHLYWHRQSESDSSHRWLKEELIRMFKR